MKYPVLFGAAVIVALSAGAVSTQARGHGHRHWWRHGYWAHGHAYRRHRRGVFSRSHAPGEYLNSPGRRQEETSRPYYSSSAAEIGSPSARGAPAPRTSAYYVPPGDYTQPSGRSQTAANGAPR